MSVVAGPGAWWRLFSEPNIKKSEERAVSGVDYPRTWGSAMTDYHRRSR
jgi:hypothetical protein